MIKLFIFDFLHKLLTIWYIVLIKLIKKESKVIGCKGVKESLKKSDTIFILAPGSSINNYTKHDFNLISKYDSIGVNNFIIHEYIPSFYLLETHSRELNYFNILKDSGKLYNTKFLYKSYASLSKKKFKNLLANLKDMPKELKNIYFAKDAYGKGKWKEIHPSFKAKMLDMQKSDFIYNYISSLNYAVLLSYKVGYKNIVLCGFDMDHKYFYCENKKYKKLTEKYSLCNNESINIVNSNEKKTKEILEVLEDVNSLLKKDRQGSLYIYGSSKLSDYFDTYPRE